MSAGAQSGVGRISAALAVAIAALLGALAMAPAASGATVPKVFVGHGTGVDCTVQGTGVQFCEGSVGSRVPTWDGVPLDVNVTLPPPAIDGPYPLIVHMHGYGLQKAGVSTDLANAGYAVLDYTARGFGNSCGSAPSRLADPTGCAKGWIHLADARYEARDTQTLAGYLADEGLIRPKRIGVTGESYGGGQSMLLATLKDRVMLPDGSFIPWTSPNGTPMAIAAAAPIIPWSDLAYSLMPNGRKLDYNPSATYGNRVGVAKQSYLTFLYTVGQSSGNYALPGVDPDADITNWFTRINQGEPYDGDPVAQGILDKIRRFHSAYYLQDSLPEAQREAPAPILAYNAWTDDLFPADETIDYSNKVHAEFPNAEFSLFYANTGGHPRASLTGLLGGGIPVYKDRVREFWDRLLMDKGGSPPPGVETFTQNCSGDPEGPFTTDTWAEQHPGEVRFDSDDPQTVTATGGDPATGLALDPFAGTVMDGCLTPQPAVDEPGVANYRLPTATGTGYTLLGSPTIVARINATDPNGQVDARLWDISPNGSEQLVTHGVYRPDVNQADQQVFQLHPNGWHFTAGHTPKLELLARDATYLQASNSTAGYTVSDLQLRLPVHEQPGGGVIQDPLKPFFPGQGPCAHVIHGSKRGERINGTSGGDRIWGKGGNDKIFGRGGADCIRGQGGKDKLSGGKGKDELSGEAGNDKVNGAAGNDVIRSRDGRRDLVNCGKGKHDRATADRRDVMRGCEKVSLPRAKPRS